MNLDETAQRSDLIHTVCNIGHKNALSRRACKAMENDCSGNDGADKLFWGIKNLSSCYVLVAVKFFSHFIGKCQGKHAFCFEIKSREVN